jgi:hypothetical protein
VNGENMDNTRCEAGRTFMIKTRKYLKKSNELEKTVRIKTSETHTKA